MAKTVRTVLPGAVFIAACLVRAWLAFGPTHALPPGQWAFDSCFLAGPVITGSLLSRRVPGSQVGAVLSWVGAAPAVVFAVETWGETVTLAHQAPAARLVYALKLGAWVWNLAGFVALCLVFPDGLLPGPRWRLVVWSGVAAGLWLNLSVSFIAPDRGGPALLPGQIVWRIPLPVVVVVMVVAFGGVLAVLVAAVCCLALRYRRGDEVVRQQLRWLMLGAGAVPVLLAAGWAAEILGASINVAYTGFMVAMLWAVPAAIAVAVLRYDLFDVDRLLGASLSWLLTTLVSASVFAVLVLFGADLLGADTELGLTGAAFVTALCLLPLHRGVNNLVGQLVDRDRMVITARMEEFVRRVRDGAAEPEAVADLLRSVLGDPELRLLLKPPTGPPGTYLGLDGEPVPVPDDATCLPLATGDSDVGVVLLGAPTARRMRRARDAVLQARLPIEVSRLRLELRIALDEARASRSRLALVTAAERQRLARDLHDGAQQQIIAVGMRLRSAQSRFGPKDPTHRDLEAAVSTLAGTVTELRRLAHGVRPSLLDDGLAAALRALVGDFPVPVEATVCDTDVPEAVATASYFVVAEALTNTLKHARASVISVVVKQERSALHIEVSDDGIGGARPGYGLTSARDRVTAVGGNLSLHSPEGAGTTIRVTI
ncbi:sensor histidine kinase [Streptomyces sp. NPDC056738]|uniref:sensor histidine kinase n=1 Tax=Streptomyces sp. NPDC056738 TaxID=3345933 RepID=UPI003688C188